MITFPNAKINLGLQVVDRRADGYHNLLTLFYPIPWRDVLEITPAQPTPLPTLHSPLLTVTGRECNCPADDNLVMKAWRAVDDYHGPLPPVDIHLRKIIPDGAGLGGGSADAAFTIRLLNDLHSLEMTPSEMALLASRIGADCPFFVYNEPMLAEGIGDELTRVKFTLEPYQLAIVKPPVAVSTREAYAGVTPRGESDHEMIDCLLHCPVEDWRGRVVNDFEPSVFRAHPELEALKAQLYDLGAVYASMSGSGSAIYGIWRPGEMPVDVMKATILGCEMFIQ